MEKLTSDTFNRWKDWTEKIKIDLQEIIDYQQVYEYFIEVVNANIQHIKDNNGLLFCNFVRKCYAKYASTGIRRHAKIEKDSISLMKLLDQLKRSSNQFTYEFYLTQYPLKSSEFEWQKSTFKIISNDGKTISEEIIGNDMQKTEEIAGKVSKFVDRVIAHLDQRGPEDNITYKDVSDSTNLFNEITCKYIRFITSAGIMTLKPTIQFDWKKIFTVPLDIRKYDSSNNQIQRMRNTPR